MSHITKIRIIHTEEYNAEAEYIKTFFEFIGILVYDEVIYSNDSFNNHLEKENDIEGVDIVLNYFANEYSYNHFHNNRLYLYFDLKKNICKLEKEASTFLFDTPNNKSRKETRINALDQLINEIWKDDEETLQSILKIKELYVPSTEDKDLFYILQAIYCTHQLLSLEFIKKANMQEIKDQKKKNRPVSSNTSSYVFNISLDDDYIKIMFFELWGIICNLKDSDDPYITYTKINTYKLLLILYSYLYDLEKYNLYELIKYNNQKIELKDTDYLYNLTRDILYQQPWFIKAYFMLIELNEIAGKDNSNIFMHLINESKTKMFPAYYSSIYHQYGLKYIHYAKNNIFEAISSYKEYINKGNELLDKALQIDPLDFRVLYDQASILAPDGRFEFANSKLMNVLFYVGNRVSDDFVLNFFTIKNNILALETYILLFKIALNRNRKYSMRGYSTNALRTIIYIENSPLINVIADDNEEAYNSFCKYMERSTSIYNLYTFLKGWIFDVSNDYHSQDTLKRILSRYDNNMIE